MQVEKFAELWTGYEHECKASVLTAGEVEISVIVDDIVNKCHMALIQMTGMHCFPVQLFFFCFYCIIVPTVFCLLLHVLHINPLVTTVLLKGYLL